MKRGARKGAFLGGARNINISLPEANDLIKKALDDYQDFEAQLLLHNKFDDKSLRVEQEQALRHLQMQWDRAFKTFIDSYVTTHPNEENISLVKELEETNYPLINTGLQQRRAVEKSLKSVLYWDFPSEQETFDFQSVLKQWYATICENYPATDTANLNQLAVRYNLRMQLKDNLRLLKEKKAQELKFSEPDILISSKLRWRMLKRSFLVGNFQEKMQAHFSANQLNYLSELSSSQLVIRFNDSKTPAWRKNHIKELILGMIEYFRQSKVRTQKLINSVIPFGACKDNEIRHQLLEAFIKPIRDNVLTDPVLVHGLAQVIRYVYAIDNSAPESTNNNNANLKGSDNLWQVLRVLFERLGKLHFQSDSTEQLESVLKAVIAVLNAMVDQGVKGLPAETALEFSNLLASLDNYKNPDIEFWVDYTHQALARVPDNTSVFQSYFGCSTKIVGSLVTLARGAACLDPGTLLDGLILLKESVESTADQVKRHKKADWYKIYRLLELYFQPDRQSLLQLLMLFKNPNFTSYPDLEYGILVALTPFLISGSAVVNASTIRLIKKLAIENLEKELVAQTNANQRGQKPKPIYTFSEKEKVQTKALQLLMSVRDMAAKDNSALAQAKVNIVKDLIGQLEKKMVDKNKKKILKNLPLGFKSKTSAIKSAAAIGEQSKVVNEVKAEKQLILQVYRERLPLDYRIEDLRRQIESSLKEAEAMEELKNYIPLKVVKNQEALTQLTTETKKALNQAKSLDKNSSLDLASEVMSFLGNLENQLLLIQGDTGTGKSLFCRYLQSMLWLNYQPGQPIPLLISLDKLKDPNSRCVEQCLESYGWAIDDIRSLKREVQLGNMSLVVILDGFATKTNIYKTNKLNEWKAKVIVTAKLQYGEYQSLFQTTKGHSFKEFYIAPFQYDQIITYLANKNGLATKTGKMRDKTLEDAKQLYQRFLAMPGFTDLIIESLHNLNKLLENTTESNLNRFGETDMQDRPTSLTLAGLIRSSELRNQEHKIEGLQITNAEIPDRESIQNYAEDLAFEMEEKEIFVIPFVANRYIKKKDREADPWRHFFKSEDPEENQILKNNRACLDLKYTSTSMQFSSEYQQKFYVACTLFKEINLEQTKKFAKDNYFNRIPLSEKPLLMRFLQEMILLEPESFNERIKALFKMIKHSVNHPECTQMAANAASLLAYMNIPFAGRKLAGINISGADLTGANLDHVDLSNAILTDAKLRNAWLLGAKLPNANLKNILFGERPYLLHKEGVAQIVYSSSQHLFITASGQHLYLWDPTTSHLKRTYKAHNKDINCIGISADGSKIISASLDRTVQLRDTSTGKIQQVLTGHKRAITSLAVSLDGRFIASGDMGQTILLWDANTGKLIREQNSVNKGWICSLDFSCDGNTLASAGSLDAIVHTWNAMTGESHYKLTGHKGYVYSVAFNFDNSLLASGADDKTICLWDMKTGSLQRSLVDNDAGYILSVKFSPDGKTIAAGSWDNVLRLWEVETGTLQRIFRGHKMPINSLAFGEDGNTLATASSDKTVRVWDVKSVEIARNSTGHTAGVRRVTFNSTGNYAASSGLDKTIRIWEVATGVLLHTLTGHTSEVRAVAFSPQNNVLVSVSNDKTLKFWDVLTGKLLKTINAHDREIINVIYSADGNTIATSSWDKSVRLWDMEGKLRLELKDHAGAVFGIAFNTDASLLVSGDQEQKLYVWDLNTGKQLHKLSGHEGGIRAVAVSPDNKTVISGSNDQTVRLWEIASGKLIQTFTAQQEIEGLIESVCFSPDGENLAAGIGDAIYIWDKNNGKILSIIEGNLGQVNSLAWHANGKLLSGSADATVKCWNLVEKTDNSMTWHLAWRTPVYLFMKNAEIDHAKDMSYINARLMQQRGAKGRSELAVEDFPGLQPLQLAVVNDDLAKVQEFSKNNPELLKICTVDGDTLLHLAAHYGANILLVFWLLRQGANSQVKNNYGSLPSDVARENGHLELLSLLEEKKDTQIKQNSEAAKTPQKLALPTAPKPTLFSKPSTTVAVRQSAPAISSTSTEKPEITLGRNEINRFNATIKTEKLYLEPISPLNLIAYAQLVEKPINMIKFANGKTFTGETAKSRIGVWFNRANQNDPFICFAIYQKEDDQFIGVVVLGYGESAGAAELIYILDEKYWGKGYGKQAVVAIVQYYAAELLKKGYENIGKNKFTDIVAIVRVDNDASCKILEAAGLQREMEKADDTKPGSEPKPKIDIKFGKGRYSYFLKTQDLIKQTVESAEVKLVASTVPKLK